MKKILVIGSLNMDLVTQVKRTPLIGETVHGTGYKEISGGKGANQAVAIGRLGGQVAMVGKVGMDSFGDTLLDNLKVNSVNSQFVSPCADKATGLAMIMVNADGDNSIVVIPGSNGELKVEDVSKEWFEGVDYVLAQLETPMETIEQAFKLAKEMNITTILNPAPARELSESLIANTDIFIPNETEFQMITGIKPETEEDISEGTKRLYDKGIKEVIITLGKQGAYYLSHSGHRYKTSAYNVKAVDTTAAGDSFIGGLLTRLSIGDSIEDAMEYAMKVGALTVGRNGAQSSLPRAKDVEEFKGSKHK